jgi:hypothetical protein
MTGNILIAFVIIAFIVLIAFVIIAFGGNTNRW